MSNKTVNHEAHLNALNQAIEQMGGHVQELAMAVSTMQTLPTAAKELATQQQQQQPSAEYGFGESELYGFEPESNHVSFAADADQYSEVSVSPLPMNASWGFDFE
jgi:hypothetical protein